MSDPNSFLNLSKGSLRLTDTLLATIERIRALISKKL